MYLVLNCNSATLTPSEDNKLSVGVDITNTNYFIDQVTDRVPLSEILKLYDLEAIEETVKDLKERGVLS